MGEWIPWWLARCWGLGRELKWQYGGWLGGWMQRGSTQTLAVLIRKGSTQRIQVRVVDRVDDRVDGR